jgi:acid phosphatase (class A)
MTQHANALLVLLLLLATATPAQDMTSGASPARDSTRPAGYLAADEYPDSTQLLPPPPAPGSAALAADQELNRQSFALRGTARWELAAQDAIPNPGSAFSCALDIGISDTSTPQLYSLLLRSGVDAVTAVSPTKRRYQRKRPFLVNEQPICVPGSEKSTARDGSYPSGHTAAGWVWALILAEIAPERADELLARGWEYGQSRAICNVHWQSDVTNGRVVGAMLLARLHANAAFRADIEHAREEVVKLRARDLPVNHDCSAEAGALAGAATP